MSIALTSALCRCTRRQRRASMAVASLVMAALTACGGGGSSKAVTAPVTATLSGTAAAGLPIIGQVTVKDSAGKTVTTSITSDGSYSVDVSGLTAPFVLRAEGTVNGSTVSYISAATSADVNGRVNITPFTDLIVANAAGRLASAFYDSPTYSNLDASSLSAATRTLTTRIQAVLDAVGVAAGFDLLHSAFSTDHTGFDAVMDVLKVTTDTDTAVATIRNLLDASQITDDLRTTTDTDTLPVAAESQLAAAVTDLQAIQTWVTLFNDLFATSLPAASNATLQTLIASDFMDDTLSRAQFLSDAGILSSNNKGLKLTATLLSRPDANHLWVTMGWSDGTESGSDAELFVKNAAGVWQLAGNRVYATVRAGSVHYRNSAGFTSWLDFGIWDSADVVQYAVVTGPGLPEGGITMARNLTDSGSGSYSIQGLSYATQWLGECGVSGESLCANLSAVGTNAVYTFQIQDSNRQLLDTRTYTLPAGPLASSVVAANPGAYFATFDPSRFLPASAAAVVNGSNLTLAWTNPTGSDCASSRVQLVLDGVSYNQTLSGNVTEALVGTWSGAAPTGPGATSVETTCSGRYFVTAGSF